MRAIATALRFVAITSCAHFQGHGNRHCGDDRFENLAHRATQSLIEREPAALLQPFFAGQPVLMSMICTPPSTFHRAGFGHHLIAVAAIDLHDSEAQARRCHPCGGGFFCVPQSNIAREHFACSNARAHTPAQQRNGKSVTPAIARREIVGECVGTDAHSRKTAGAAASPDSQNLSVLEDDATLSASLVMVDLLAMCVSLCGR